MPAALDELIMSCLAHSREKRPQSMDEVMRRFADAIPAGHSLLPYVAPRFVFKEAAPLAPTISDGMGPAVAQLVGNTSGRIATKRGAVAAALVAGVLVGIVAMMLANRASSSHEARPVAGPPTSGASRVNAQNAALVPAPASNRDAGTDGPTNVFLDADTEGGDAAPPSAPVAPIAPTPEPSVASTSRPSHEAPAAASPSDAPANERKTEKKMPAPPPTPPTATRSGAKPAPVARTGDGIIVVRVSPWATVWIDGVPYQTTPVRATVPAGTHKVLLVADGHREKVSVTVTAATESLVERKW
jgi:hypothetical protein